MFGWFKKKEEPLKKEIDPRYVREIAALTDAATKAEKEGGGRVEGIDLWTRVGELYPQTLSGSWTLRFVGVTAYIVKG